MVMLKSLRSRTLITRLVLPLIAALLTVGNATGKTVLLDFSSPHCGPCQQMRPIIRDLIAAGYPIREVDVTREPRLANEFRVSGVPSFILLVDGKVVDRIDGRVGRSDIEAMFRRVRFEPEPETMVRGQSPNRRPLGKRLRDRITGVTAAPSVESSVAPPFAPSVAPSVAPSAAPVSSPFAHNPTLPPTASPAGQPTPSFESASTPVASPNLINARPNAQRLIEATVRIQVVDAVGQSYGTGTVIQVGPGYAIVLTCGHLFRETRGQSPVSVDLFRQTAAGPQATTTVQGRVLHYDLDRDVGLIRIDTAIPIQAIDLAPEGSQPRSGDSVVSVGCDHGEAPTIRGSHVTTINRYSGPSNIEATGVPVEGRSGGGLFNAQGQLIGVCFAADERGNEGLYSGLPSVYEELLRAGIATGPNAAASQVAANLSVPQTAVAATESTMSVPPTTTRPPSQPETVGPRPSSTSAATNLVAVNPLPVTPLSVNPAPIRPGPFSPAEHAALEEVARRAAGAEVIFIIRSKEPGGSSQVITLDAASPEFIAALRSAARGGSRSRLTSHEIANLPPR